MAMILVFFGLTASGKSTLAQACAARWQAPHYNTDRIRKELAGLAATTSCPAAPGQGIYSQQLSAQTYQSLLQRAEEALRSRGEQLIILDGSYASRAERERVRRLAEQLKVTVRFLYCWCGAEETKRRLQRRAADAQAISDGRWEIYLHQLESFETPLATETDILSLDTEASVETLLTRIDHILPLPQGRNTPCAAPKKMHFLYWGKRCGGESGHWHHLCHHGLDAAAVTQALLQENPLWQTQVQTLSPYSPEHTKALLLFLAACHDLGKFSDAFQFRLPSETTWTPPLQRSRPVCLPPGRHHTELGLTIWEELCPQDFLPLPDSYTLKPLLTAALAHHGQPKGAFFGPQAKPAPQVMADIREYLIEIAELFDLSSFPEAGEFALNRLSFVAAGLFILADWVASNERWFGPDSRWIDAKTYFSKAQTQATQALDDLSFLKETAPGTAKGFHALLPHLAGCTPSAMQQAILDLPQAEGPELLIIEDLTGGGKTEAALLATHRLLHSGQSRGLFVGLPTMATADAMYRRLEGSYQALFAERTSLMLAHGATALNQDFLDSISQDYRESIMPDAGDQESGGAVCAQWLADNRKKALLSPCGVGTIDQALLAVLKTRHQALRLFGLSRSVFIGDEVHAFDEYTGTLLKNLLTFHAAMGGSAVLLSATLPHKLRQTFVDAWRAGRAQYGEKPLAAPLISTDFPLLTRVTDETVQEQQVAEPEHAGLRRKEDVRVRLLHEEGGMYAALQTAARAGACACWVRNTVGDVREAWQKLTGKYGVPADKVLVFHAAFAGVDRQRIEGKVLDYFGKKDAGKDGVIPPRAGYILLATQVVEQSLDLDFDLLLSDLAPMDLLIQRAGRCHRHKRHRSEGYAMPLVLVLTPEPLPDATANWYAAMFPAAQYVYPRHALLWRTAKLLEMAGRLHLPEEARYLIEGAAGNEAAFAGPPAVAPATLDDREDCADGEDYGKRSMAHFSQLAVDAGYLPDNLWPDDARAPTRLGEEMQNVRLLRLAADGLHLWAEGQGRGFMQACLLSEVRVRRRKLCEAVNPPDFQQALDALQQKMPDKGQWCRCLVLREENGIWVGRGKKDGGQEVEVRYSVDFGLDVS